jgi:hypothetical protein
MRRSAQRLTPNGQAQPNQMAQNLAVFDFTFTDDQGPGSPSGFADAG